MALSRFYILFVLFIGVMLVVIGNSPVKTDVPVENVNTIQTVNDSNMFDRPSPWVIDNENFENLKQGNINRFYISQV
jgi:hypothetical protein